jgi:hypothetical protein
LAYVAGCSRVRAVLGDFDGIWLIALAGALLVSFVGYHYAYRGIFRVEGGPVLPRRQMRAVVAAGFGGFLAHGGGALDQHALQAAGAEEDEAKARVAALGGLEHGVLAISDCAAAIAVLVSGRGQPPMDFTIPWAVIPIPGFLIGFWAAGRYGGRFRGRAGWRGKLGIFLGAPLAVAVAGVFVYRVLAFLLPMPVSLAALPTLRQMAQRPPSQVKDADDVNEPALQP